MPDEIIASCDVVCGADENDVVCLPSLTILNSLRLTFKTRIFTDKFTGEEGTKEYLSLFRRLSTSCKKVK